MGFLNRCAPLLPILAYCGMSACNSSADISAEPQVFFEGGGREIPAAAEADLPNYIQNFLTGFSTETQFSAIEEALVSEGYLCIYKNGVLERNGRTFELSGSYEGYCFANDLAVDVENGRIRPTGAIGADYIAFDYLGGALDGAIRIEFSQKALNNSVSLRRQRPDILNLEPWSTVFEFGPPTPNIDVRVAGWRACGSFEVKYEYCIDRIGRRAELEIIARPHVHPSITRSETGGAPEVPLSIGFHPSLSQGNWCKFSTGSNQPMGFCRRTEAECRETEIRGVNYCAFDRFANR